MFIKFLITTIFLALYEMVKVDTCNWTEGVLLLNNVYLIYNILSCPEPGLGAPRVDKRPHTHDGWDQSEYAMAHNLS